jgi:quercetin 2,3-dioxygenase
LPDRKGIMPSYEQKTFQETDKRNTLKLIAGPPGDHDAVTINQDARLYSAILEADHSVPFVIAPERYGWLQVARGSIELNGTELSAGDAAAIHDEPALMVHATEKAEILLFDLA